MITVVVQNKGPVEIDEQAIEGPVCIRHLVEQLKLTAPEQATGVMLNGKMVDHNTQVQDGDEIALYSFEDKEGKEVYWHTTAHVLAQAVLRLWPDAKPTIGPPIENGFYYDFYNLNISEEDFDQIEKEMQKICKENFRTERTVFSSKQEALEAFKDNPYKEELIKGFDDSDEFTAYKQGEFFDLCRGPHLPNLGKIKALKVLKTSGAYWRGQSDREMLTRIYAISFPDRKLLKDYLHQLEEAKKRDHKVLGPKLDLYSIKEQGPGMPFIHPKGMVMWNRLLEYWRECHQRQNYVEIKTPIMLSKELWELSGHWENYRENMYTTAIEEREYAIKPMNCPGGMLYFKTAVHSYREFPLRVGEIGTVHRHEPSGAVSGLFRVRCFHQDDAHIFLENSQIEEEIINILKLVDEMYSTFGLSYHLELSTRPEKNTIGSDEDWQLATEGLEGALQKLGRGYKINPGDGAFYGPKIDIHVKDAIGRTWQCGTIQLDMSLPQKFDLEYSASDGTRKRPVMLHRVVYGSIERFFGILIEHYAGKFPLWLSPRQMRIITVADRHIDYAQTLATRLREEGFEVEVDDTGESISKKVREAQLLQANYILTIGDQELEAKNLSLRTRDNRVIGALSTDEFIAKCKTERDEKAALTVF